MITGRTLSQGRSAITGKDTEAYRREVSTLQMNPRDMERLGVSEGDRVSVKRGGRAVTLTVRRAVEEVAEGVAYLPYGEKASKLSSGDTEAAGMPLMKGIEVDVDALED